MKNYIGTLIFCTTLSVGAQLSQPKPTIATAPEISNIGMESSDEEKTRRFAKDYIAHINRKNWIEGIDEYLPENHEAFLKEHMAFRKSFPNYKATIKRMFVDGNEVILWLNITANYVENFRYKNSNYGDQLLWDFEAKNQALDWDEIWYFNVVDGKFGDKWDSLKDNHQISMDLKAGGSK